MKTTKKEKEKKDYVVVNKTTGKVFTLPVAISEAMHIKKEMSLLNKKYQYEIESARLHDLL